MSAFSRLRLQQRNWEAIQARVPAVLPVVAEKAPLPVPKPAFTRVAVGDAGRRRHWARVIKQARADLKRLKAANPVIPGAVARAEEWLDQAKKWEKYHAPD